MPYRSLDDIAIADAAFEAWGDSIADMLRAAADALLGVMIAEPASVKPDVRREFRVEDERPDMLLFGFLQELIYYKDAEQLLLRVEKIDVDRRGERWIALAHASGEPIDPLKHELIVDVKAITLHRLQALQTERGWTATVVVDV